MNTNVLRYIIIVISIILTFIVAFLDLSKNDTKAQQNNAVFGYFESIGTSILIIGITYLCIIVTENNHKHEYDYVY